MPVVPYFPEPIEVSRNLTRQPHNVMMGFARRISIVHGLVVAAVFALALSDMQIPLERYGLPIFLGSLIALTLVRRFVNGGFWDNISSQVLMIPTILGASICIRILDANGWPMWAIGLIAGLCSLYSVVAGRDFSFGGQFFLATGCASIAILGAWLTHTVSGQDAWIAWLMMMGYGGFTVYNSTTILRRRRIGEDPAAVADYWRDLINFTTYWVRVIQHWKRFNFI